MKNLAYSVAGAAVGIVSAILLTDYSLRKKQDRPAYTGVLLASVAGLIAGAAIAYQPEREAKKCLTVQENLLDENEISRVKESANEVLGHSADRGTAPENLRTIEVDEETSIEDFL